MIWSRLALRNQLRALLALPADVAELAREMRDARSAAEATLAMMQRPRPRWAQVLVLWNAPPRLPPVLQVRVDAAARQLGITPEEIGPLGNVQTPVLGFRSEEQRDPVPGLLSLSFDLNDERTKSYGVRSDSISSPIPAGAWLVACGCLVSQVFVGNELQDVGSGVQGLPLRVLRLRDAIGVGYYLRCGVVIPDEGRT